MYTCLYLKTILPQHNAILTNNLKKDFKLLSFYEAKTDNMES